MAKHSLDRKIIIVSGTRADYGKLKPIIKELINPNNKYDCRIFVTGMHLLRKYGSTFKECEKDFPFLVDKFINQNEGDSMEVVLGKTILGFSDYVSENQPDLIIVHGDRVEALACSIVGALKNVLVAHIEGGEISGTIDESLRHAVTKMSHIHFVSNESARTTLLQLGERNENIHVIGSPEVDIFNSKDLPSIKDVKKRYNITFDEFSILLYHSVTTEIDMIDKHTTILLDDLVDSKENFVVIYPNNDEGSDRIIRQYLSIKDNKNFHFLPSMRFEHFVSLIKNCKFMVGNSSSGVREAPFLGVPSINVGSRQNGRSFADSVFHTSFSKGLILQTIKVLANKKQYTNVAKDFGTGNSGQKFIDILSQDLFWEIDKQKYFMKNE